MSITINQSINLSLSLYSINCFSRTRTYRFSPCMRSCQGEFPPFFQLFSFTFLVLFLVFLLSLFYPFFFSVTLFPLLISLHVLGLQWSLETFRVLENLYTLNFFFFDNSFFFSLDKIFLFNFLAMNDIKFSALFPSILENFILFFSCFSLLFFPRSCCLFGFFDYLFDFVFFSLYRDWFFCSLAIQC